MSLLECVYCGERRLPMEIEHVRPLSRGGTDDNVVTACKSCNRQKGTMLLHEWMAWRKTHGMTWPPVASHATRKQPEHYQDGTGCDLRSEPGPACGHTIECLSPVEMRLTDHGYEAFYKCPVHERHYRVSWSISPYYYDDCPCAYCIATRAEDAALGLGNVAAGSR